MCEGMCSTTIPCFSRARCRWSPPVWKVVLEKKSPPLKCVDVVTHDSPAIRTLMPAISAALLSRVDKHPPRVLDKHGLDLLLGNPVPPKARHEMPKHVCVAEPAVAGQHHFDESVLCKRQMLRLPEP